MLEIVANIALNTVMLFFVVIGLFVYVVGWAIGGSWYLAEQAYHRNNDWWLLGAITWLLFWITLPVAAAMTIAQG